MAIEPKRRARPGLKATLQRVVVGAATSVDLDSLKALNHRLGQRDDWQKLASKFFDADGNLKHAVNFIGDTHARVKLVACEVPTEPGQEPIPTDDPLAIEALQRIAGDDGTHAEIMRALGKQLTLVGECYLVGLTPRVVDDELRPERWWIASIDEVEKKSGTVHVTDPETGESIALLSPKAAEKMGGGVEPDFFGRIWNPHAMKQSKPDSSVRGILDDLEILGITGRYIRSTTRSRIASNRLVFIPNSMTLQNPAEEVPLEPQDNSLIQSLMNAWNVPIQNEDSAAATTPVFLTGDPAQDGNPGWAVLQIDRPLDQQILAYAEFAQRSFAQGINLPVEFIFGLGEANHWGAGQIERSAFDHYLAPGVVLSATGLTRTYYRPVLKAMGHPTPNRFMIWHDASDLTVDEVPVADIQAAHAAYVVSDAYYREAIGAEEEDAPTPEEIERRIIQDLARRGTQPTAVDLEAPPVAPAPAPTQASVRAAAYADLGERLYAIDRDLATRLDALVSQTLRRALEHAGARIARKAQQDRAVSASCAGIAPHEVGRTLGPVLVATLGLDAQELVTDAVDSLRERFLGLVGKAQQAAARTAGVDLSPDAAEDAEDAWTYLRGALVARAQELLYGPPAESPLGEIPADPAVPFDVIREAMSIAGGSGSMGADTVLSALRTKARELAVAVGYRVLKALGFGGVYVEGWSWRYGAAPRSRPFEPHQNLDGVSYVYDDDPELASDGWPDAYYAVGDHPGCQCGAVPKLVKRVGEEVEEL